MDTMGNLLRRRRESPAADAEPDAPPKTETATSEKAEAASPRTPERDAGPTGAKPAARETPTPGPTAAPATAAVAASAPLTAESPRAGGRSGRTARRARGPVAVPPPEAGEGRTQEAPRDPDLLRRPPQSERVSVTFDPALRERARIALNAAHNTGDYRLGDFADVLREAAVLLVSGAFAERQLRRLPKATGPKATTTLRVNSALYDRLLRISKKKRSELLQRALVTYLEKGFR